MLDAEHVRKALLGAKADLSERAGSGADERGRTPIELLNNKKFSSRGGQGYNRELGILT